MKIKSSLIDAIVENDAETVAALLAQGANPNANDKAPKGKKPLILAAELNRPQIAQLLADAGANPNATVRAGSRSKLTPLMIAARKGRVELASVLEPVSDLSKKDPFNGWTAAFYAAAAPSFLARKKEIWAIVAKRSNLAQKDQFESTLLHTAAMSRALHCLPDLTAVVDVNAKDAGGGTALMRAAAEGDVEMIQALADAGADWRALDRRETSALGWAAWSGRLDAMRAVMALSPQVKAEHGREAFGEAMNHYIFENRDIQESGKEPTSKQKGLIERLLACMKEVRALAADWQMDRAQAALEQNGHPDAWGQWEAEAQRAELAIAVAEASGANSARAAHDGARPQIGSKKTEKTQGADCADAAAEGRAEREAPKRSKRL